MNQIWLVHCEVCGGSFTGAKPPGHPEFTETVNCIQCGRELDAKKGRHVLCLANTKKEQVSLLKVN